MGCSPCTNALKGKPEGNRPCQWVLTPRLFQFSGRWVPTSRATGALAGLSQSPISWLAKKSGATKKEATTGLKMSKLVLDKGKLSSPQVPFGINLLHPPVDVCLKPG